MKSTKKSMSLSTLSMAALAVGLMAGVQAQGADRRTKGMIEGSTIAMKGIVDATMGCYFGPVEGPIAGIQFFRGVGNMTMGLIRVGCASRGESTETLPFRGIGALTLVLGQQIFGSQSRGSVVLMNLGDAADAGLGMLYAAYVPSGAASELAFKVYSVAANAPQLYGATVNGAAEVVDAMKVPTAKSVE